MMQAIMKIGEWAGKRDDVTDYINNFVQNPNEKGNIRIVLEITLDKERDSFHFKDVEIREFKQKYLLKYLYRRGSASGSDVTPTSKYAGDIKKTFKNKILRCIQNIKRDAQSLGLCSAEQENIKMLYDALFSDENAITKRLLERAGELEKREGAIITLVFLENGQERYLGDIDLFRKVLLSRSREKYFKQYGKLALSNNRVCSVCFKERPEVYGFVNTYNFYTVDKPGFVTGGFKQQDAWKNYPVCLECAGNLELGKKYLNSKLVFRFYGYRYILIPKFLSNKIIDEALKALEYTFDRRDNSVIKASFEKSYINRITDAEDEILGYIREPKDYISFDLLFYREKQAAFNILLHVEDILPSRFRKLFAVKTRLDQIDIFKNLIYPDTGKRVLFFNFGLLRRFFPLISKTQSYDKHFLELAGKIFSLRPIDYHLIISAISRIIHLKFIRGEYLKTDCLAGYMLLNYLADLGILSKGGEHMEVEPIHDLKEDFSSAGNTVFEKIELFFETHAGFFDSPEKKACFLVGVLVQKLLNIQKRRAQGTKPPFLKKMQGLRLSEYIVRKISYEAQNKLEQYNENYYHELENIIAQHMVVAGSKWRMTNDEIGFYFTMGMNLTDLFKTDKEENNDDKSQE